jgi:hypothetical protein
MRKNDQNIKVQLGMVNIPILFGKYEEESFENELNKNIPRFVGKKMI